MGLSALVRRVRAFGGHFLLLAVLALVTVLLISGVPRVANRLAGDGLRRHLAAQPAAQRDLTYLGNSITTADGVSMTRVRGQTLDRLPREMPPEVSRTLAERWYQADLVPARLLGPDLAARNLLVDLTLRQSPTMRQAATVVAGRWPGERQPVDGPVEVALDAEVAGTLNLRVGSRLRLRSLEQPLKEQAPLVVVGLFTAKDEADGIWDGLPQTLEIAEPQGDQGPLGVVAVTGAGGLDRMITQGWTARFSWRYRMGAERIDVRELDRVVAAITELQRTPPRGTELVQGADILLGRFADTVNAARTVLAVIAAGVLATLAGLVVLAAGLAARRRRDEFALIRARGGAATSGAARSLAEALLVVPAAAVAGWLLGTVVPGAPGETGRLAVTAAVAITLALPVATLAATTTPGGRRDLVRLRPSTRRLTLELSLLGLAVLAAVLLRRRGLTLGTVDPLLVAVPVLLAVGAAVLALRFYPWPLRLVTRIAARTRGSVAFLGAARAGRSVVTTPLVVVVVAVATAAFCTVAAAGIEASRDRAVTRALPADALVAADRLAPATASELAGLPGVRAVTPVLTEPGQRLLADAVGTDARIGEAAVLLVDGAGLTDVARDAGVDVSVPEVLRAGAAGNGPAPAVVSPALAADLAEAGLDDGAFVTVQGRRYAFRVAGTAEEFPLVDPGTSRYVVLPWSALPAAERAALAPTGFLVAGDRLDSERLRQVGEEGQRRYQRSGTVTGGEPPRGAEVRTWAETRAQLGGSGANGLLAFGFVAGAAGGTVLGLLAIAFMVLAGARDRGQVLSRLRTLGLSRGQWRGLLLVELAPLVAVSVLTGAVTGALLPLLLTPVLGLSAFTAGVPVRVAFEPGLVAGVVVLAVVALGFAVAVEAVNNRRLRLGEVLRLGEES